MEEAGESWRPRLSQAWDPCLLSAGPMQSVPRAPKGCGCVIPRAAVTRHPQLGVLKQQKFFSLLALSRLEGQNQGVTRARLHPRLCVEPLPVPGVAGTSQPPLFATASPQPLPLSHPLPPCVPASLLGASPNVPPVSPYQGTSYLGLRYPPRLQDDLVLVTSAGTLQEGPILRCWGLGPRGIFLGDTGPPTPEATPPRDARSDLSCASSLSGPQAVLL